VAFGTTTFNAATLSKMIRSIMTLSIMDLIVTLSIVDLIVTFSIMDFIVTLSINAIKHNDTQHEHWASLS
jgi:hypothetical protein